jgi:predicted nucleotide-binding protein
MARSSNTKELPPANLSVEQMRLGIGELKRQIAHLEGFDPKTLPPRSEDLVHMLESSVGQTLERVFGIGTKEYDAYHGAANLSWISSFDAEEDYPRYVAEGRYRAIVLLREAVNALEDQIRNSTELSPVPPADASMISSEVPRKVFVVHGHDDTPKAEVARFIEQLGFQAVILHERANRGRALITKFREEAAGVGFAIVLMTPDDLGKARAETEMKPRARQNVVFELGFFVGKLGSERVAAMVKGGIELLSDFYGVVYIRLDKADWRTELGMELQAAGFQIDWNKLMRRQDAV